MEYLQVGMVSMTSTPWAVEENCRRLEAYVREAAGRQARLVVTPEAALDGYVCIADPTATRDRMLEVAQTIPRGKYVRRAAAWCRELGIFLVLGLLERDRDRLYNTSLLLDPKGQVLLRYRKVHPDVEAFITPGKELAPTDTPLGRVGMLICSDRNTVDNWSTLGVQGVEIVLVPMNGSGGPENTATLRQRARDNYCAIVVANSWSSALIGPLGELYLERYESECVSVGRLFVAHAPKGNERRQFSERRPDLYGPLLSNRETQPMFDAQGEPTPSTLALRDTFRQNRLRCREDR